MRRRRPAIIAALAVSLAACASRSDPIVQDKEMGYMSRAEVTSAIEDCQSAGQRASVIYTRTNWRGKNVPAPVDVQCLPVNNAAARRAVAGG